MLMGEAAMWPVAPGLAHHDGSGTVSLIIAISEV
jgi:hypothetical protein